MPYCNTKYQGFAMQNRHCLLYAMGIFSKSIIISCITNFKPLSSNALQGVLGCKTFAKGAIACTTMWMIPLKSKAEQSTTAAGYNSQIAIMWMILSAGYNNQHLNFTIKKAILQCQNAARLLKSSATQR